MVVLFSLMLVILFILLVTLTKVYTYTFTVLYTSLYAIYIELYPCNMLHTNMDMIVHSITHSTCISTGTQLTICKESCYVVDVIGDRCDFEFTNAIENKPGVFVDYFSNFNCSSPESYLIPGLPPDTEQCLQADDFCKFAYSYTHINLAIYVHVL